MDQGEIAVCHNFKFKPPIESESLAELKLKILTGLPAAARVCFAVTIEIETRARCGGMPYSPRNPRTFMRASAPPPPLFAGYDDPYMAHAQNYLFPPAIGFPGTHYPRHRDDYEVTGRRSPFIPMDFIRDDVGHPFDGPFVEAPPLKAEEFPVPHPAFARYNGGGSSGYFKEMRYAETRDVDGYNGATKVHARVNDEIAKLSRDNYDSKEQMKATKKRVAEDEKTQREYYLREEMKAINREEEGLPVGVTRYPWEEEECLTEMSATTGAEEVMDSLNMDNSGNTAYMAPTENNAPLSSSSNNLGDHNEYVVFTSTYKQDIQNRTHRILMILNARDCEVEVVDLYTHPQLRSMMEEVSGDRHSLPQIVINGRYLDGGLEELQWMHDNDMHEAEADIASREERPNAYTGVPVRDLPPSPRSSPSKSARIQEMAGFLGNMKGHFTPDHKKRRVHGTGA